MSSHIGLRRVPQCRSRRVLIAGLIGVFAVAWGASGLAQSPTTLRLASTPWSPFTNVPGQTRVALDLVHTALQRIGVTAETTIVPDGTLTPALLAGTFDGSAAMWRAAPNAASPNRARASSRRTRLLISYLQREDAARERDRSGPSREHAGREHEACE